MVQKSITIRVENRKYGYCFYIGEYTLLLDFRCCGLWYGMVHLIKILEESFQKLDS